MATANIYCVPSDMVDIMSYNGVDLRRDDTPPTAYGGAAAKAGNQIDKYCFRRYAPADLATSDLVKDWAATIAVYYLCCRRGNTPPNGIAIMYDEALVDLKEIKNGINDIPGIPIRRGYAPVMSVMRATQRPFPRAVVETSRGSSAAAPRNPVSYHANRDAWDAFGLNTNLDLVF